MNHCLRGSSWPVDLLETLLRMASHPDEDRARAGSHALFSIVVERLGDLFEPALCDTYASLFSYVVEYVRPEFVAADLLARYRRVRMPRRFEGLPERIENVFVLSRVTLGADVAITSVLLDAVKHRFPRAGVQFVGTHKSYELFAADPRVQHVPVSYGRTATLRERLSVWPELEQLLQSPRSIVIDPDSRLTQLGILPVCPEENYYFFESRGYGEYGPEPLCALTRRWARETFDVESAKAYIAPTYQAEVFESPTVAMSFGVGENPAKRIRDPFEEDLLRALIDRGLTVVIDKGAGGDEKERVERAVARSGAREGQVR
ncbi:MAG TPA: hypothetical protein DEH78_08855, partial [Solibacterales bacterium]|nr:hypothetical protein [Bryobacterales bacterium]